MSILIGHPTGNPNSQHAALAHWQAGRLAAFVVPWFPSRLELALLQVLPGFRNQKARLSRRWFEPLTAAPKIQGRLGEWRRLLQRQRGADEEKLAYEANDWLMQTMKRECHRSNVTAVHSYEDCSLWQFEEARRLGLACLYDMPIGYYPAWEKLQASLTRRFADWLPKEGLPLAPWVRPEQKRREMELADLVLAPSTFVQRTILQFHPEKKVALAPYGVDTDFWHPSATTRTTSGKLRFIYAGQMSIRKGIPILLEAWVKAALPDATLVLVGSWQLAEKYRTQLPANVEYHPACSSAELRRHYQEADVFLFPSFFEGFGLVLLEAMACGLPAVATDATAGPDILDASTGKIVACDKVEELIDAMRWFTSHRDQLPAMSLTARAKAKEHTWSHYRQCVTTATASFA